MTVTRDTRAQVFHLATRKRVKHRKHPPYNPETLHRSEGEALWSAPTGHRHVTTAESYAL